jgi:hypothetical protein
MFLAYLPVTPLSNFLVNELPTLTVPLILEQPKPAQRIGDSPKVISSRYSEDVHNHLSMSHLRQ